MNENIKLYCDKEKLSKAKINRNFFNNEKMHVIENDSFNNKYSDDQRINIEYNRIREKLNSDSNLLVTYINEFTELEKMISMLSFDKSLGDQIKVKIVELQMLCGIKVRFTSAMAEALKNEKVAIMLLESFEKSQRPDWDMLPEYDINGQIINYDTNKEGISR